MTEEFKKQIETEARQAVTELLAQAKLKKGDVFVDEAEYADAADKRYILVEDCLATFKALARP